MGRVKLEFLHQQVEGPSYGPSIGAGRNLLLHVTIVEINTRVLPHSGLDTNAVELGRQNGLEESSQ